MCKGIKKKAIDIAAKVLVKATENATEDDVKRANEHVRKIEAKMAKKKNK